MTLTKADLADRLLTLGVSKPVAKEIVDLMFEEMRRALERGEHVKVSGFGNFDLRNKFPRPGRNPKTGEEKMISGRRVVTFKAGNKLKEIIEKFSQKKETEN